MYNYYEEVKEDVKSYIENEIDFTEFNDLDELEDYLNDTLWADDGVTGNASGSYYCNDWRAEEAIAHNWDLLAEALAEFGQNGTDILKEGAEAMDVTIRCYVLGSCIADAMEEIAEEFNTAHEEDENGNELFTYVEPERRF